jgi:hypothetical protein
VIPQKRRLAAAKLKCPCGHTGIVSDSRLPCELHCWSCGTSRRVEPDGDARIIGTERRTERANAIIEAFRKIS